MTDHFTQPPEMQTVVPPLLWGCPRTESRPASAVSEPVALSPPVIQSTASHTSHIALPGLQPSRVSLTTLSQRASLVRPSQQALAPLLGADQGRTGRRGRLSAVAATGAVSLLTISGFCGGIALTDVPTASQAQSSESSRAWRALPVAVSALRAASGPDREDRAGSERAPSSRDRVVWVRGHQAIGSELPVRVKWLASFEACAGNKRIYCPS